VDAAQCVVGLPPITFICWAWVAKSSANILLRADSYGPPSLIASAMPAWSRVTEVLVITAEPAGIRAGNGGQRLWVVNVCVVRGERSLSVLGA
jgi:hypothetical protein